MRTALVVALVACVAPCVTAWNGGLPSSLLRGDSSKASRNSRSPSASAAAWSMSAGGGDLNDGFGRRDAMSALFASATLLSLTGPAAANDVGDGGLPPGLKEYFEMLQTKKQVSSSAPPLPLQLRAAAPPPP